MLEVDAYQNGFEEDDQLRSAFIRDLTLHQLKFSTTPSDSEPLSPTPIPKTLIRYWHDQNNVPSDVQSCLNSWERLREEDFKFVMFNDTSAAAYIKKNYGAREIQAFTRCRHPAMRSDYLRMCFVLAEGGLYVDADDVFLGSEWKSLFQDNKLKVQPLCYDISTAQMVPAVDIWRANLSTNERIFYVNNNPIAAPAGHPILSRALARSTERLLADETLPEIQSTTGPGNFSASLAAHALELCIANTPFDFELLRNWDAIAETRWELSYRNDARNWRNMES